MEREIGEIFEYNGEWYQCIGNPYNECTDCDFCFETGKACVRQIVGQCSMSNRSDGLSVVFKRLEKVGEMYEKRVSDGTSSTFQRYRVYNSVILQKEPYIYCNFIDSTVEIEIKQTKEEMKDKKLNLKRFDLEAAKAGKPVCTRDGRKARIICFDRNWDMNIVALVSDPFGESVHYYLSNGKVDFDKQNDEDLMMLPEKKEGWVNLYKSSVHSTKKEAMKYRNKCNDYIDTIKIEWEE